MWEAGLAQSVDFRFIGRVQNMVTLFPFRRFEAAGYLIADSSFPSFTNSLAGWG
jgi:hypothetical protein